MFLNYSIDLKSVGDAFASEAARVFYDAQIMTSKVVICVTGLCLLLTTAVTLLFNIKTFIDSHKRELGILKAIGYSDIKIASNFVTFGLSVLLGTAVGFGLAFAVMPKLYSVQNNDGILPYFPVRFHAEILAYFVILPSIAFAGIAVLYAYYKLKKPVIGLLKNREELVDKPHKHLRESKRDTPFLKGLTLSTLKSKKVLAFFIWFSAFCFAAMIQMGASMRDLASEMMMVMILIIGIVLASATLILAISTVVKANFKNIAVMRAFGYPQIQCANAILGGYRPFAYFGFVIGTVYQYVLLKLMVSLIFKDVQGVPDYKFDFVVMAITLAAFIVVYEGVTFICAERLKHVTLKRIMEE